jgi:alcohol dehydrogenase class IV
MQFQFTTAGQIIFGSGKHREIGTQANSLGKKALLVVGSGGANPQMIAKLLDEAGITFTSFAVHGEPTIELIENAVDFARLEQCDFVIAFGGGSVLDSGKAISAMLTNPGDLLDYLEVVGKGLPLQNQAAPMIAMPTTAGTGTEVTKNAVLLVTDQKVKVSMRSSLMIPSIALVDPELSLSMPPAVTASSGMDALTQVIEPYVSAKANPLTDLFAREGIQRAARSLKEAYRNGSNLSAREDMAWASLLGGLCLANAGLGAVHGFAGPLGGMFDAPHGAVCARLLPLVSAMNVKALQERTPQHISLLRYLEIARAMTGDQMATIEDGISWLEDLALSLQIPGLASYGITTADIPLIVDKSKVSSSMKGNPIILTEDELSEVLEKAL